MQDRAGKIWERMGFLILSFSNWILSSPGPLQSVIVMKLTQRDRSSDRTSILNVTRLDVFLGSTGWMNTSHKKQCKKPLNLSVKLSRIFFNLIWDPFNFVDLQLLVKYRTETISPKFNSLFQSGSGVNHSRYSSLALKRSFSEVNLNCNNHFCACFQTIATCVRIQISHIYIYIYNWNNYLASNIASLSATISWKHMLHCYSMSLPAKTVHCICAYARSA